MNLTKLNKRFTESRWAVPGARKLQGNGTPQSLRSAYHVGTGGETKRPRLDSRDGAAEDIALSLAHTRSLADEGDARPSAGMMVRRTDGRRTTVHACPHVPLNSMQDSAFVGQEQLCARAQLCNVRELLQAGHRQLLCATKGCADKHKGVATCL